MSLSRPLSRGVSIAARHLRVASSMIGRSSLSSSLFSSPLTLSSPLSSSLRSFHHQSLTAFASPASSSPSSGRVEFLLADIGEGIAEVELIKWFVKAGDSIQQFDPVCEVQSDKATVPITSRYDGKIIELKYQPGQIAAVGKALMIIEIAAPAAGESAAAATSPTPSTPSSSPAAPSSSSSPSAEFTSTNAEQFLTSPAVRRLAKEQKVDLSHVQPTGPGGRILKEDVLKFIEASANGQAPKRVAPPTPPTTAAAPRSTPTPAPVATPAAAPSKDKAISPLPQYLTSDITTQVSGLARIMVQTMNAANAVPTFGYGDEVNVEELVKLREAVKGIAEKKYGIKLTYLPFLIKAASLALRHYPQLNAHVNADCTQVTQKADHNIGLAVDTPRGLIVPNIKKVQERSIFEIGAELQRISALAQQGRLGKEDLTGGTFTLSNIGSIGGTYMSPILVVPEVMIGALGGFQLRPRYDASMNLKATRVMNISWSGDHRVLDGATVARFSNQWKYYIEHPFAMVAELK